MLMATALSVGTMCVVVALSGCGGEDAPMPADRSSTTVTDASAVVTSPDSSTVSAPVEVEPSPEELAARDAFQKMTAEGVSPEEVDAATHKIESLGSAALPVLAEGLKSDESIKRDMAATMLAMLGAAAADVSDALIVALGDESDFVRANVATALAQMEGQAAHVIPVFGELLESDDPKLQTMAAMNLGFLDPAAAKPLIGQLTQTLDSDDPTILRPVVELLGKIGPDARPAIEKIRSLDTSKDPELETAVNVALMQIETQIAPEADSSL